MTKRSIAVILAIFLGGLGIHRMYVGQFKTGIVYLLFVWTFIPSLLGLVDAIRYISMSESQFNKKYSLS